VNLDLQPVGELALILSNFHTEEGCVVQDRKKLLSMANRPYLQWKKVACEGQNIIFSILLDGWRMVHE